MVNVPVAQTLLSNICSYLQSSTPLTETPTGKSKARRFPWASQPGGRGSREEGPSDIQISLPVKSGPGAFFSFFFEESRIGGTLQYWMDAVVQDLTNTRWYSFELYQNYFDNYATHYKRTRNSARPGRRKYLKSQFMSEVEGKGNVLLSVYPPNKVCPSALQAKLRQ